ncbi:MAG: 30S ribosomal protein S17 [Chloroflexi bacterium]|nr:30S ribosomal protein S17 [Chloroflexota bacterium]
MIEQRGRRRTLVGRVAGDKMNKTVVVAVEAVRRHRLYGKIMRRTRKFKAHDPENRYRRDDLVEIRESRPLSREKRWIVTRLVRSGQAEIPVADPTTEASS